MKRENFRPGIEHMNYNGPTNPGPYSNLVLGSGCYHTVPQFLYPNAFSGQMSYNGPMFTNHHNPAAGPCYAAPQPFYPYDTFNVRMAGDGLTSSRMPMNTQSDNQSENSSELKTIETTLTLNAKLSKTFTIYGTFADMEVEILKVSGVKANKNNIIKHVDEFAISIKKIYLMDDDADIDFSEAYSNKKLARELGKYLVENGHSKLLSLGEYYVIESECNYEMVAWMLGDKLLAAPIFSNIESEVENISSGLNACVSMYVFDRADIEYDSRSINVVVINGKEHKAFAVEGSVVIGNHEIDDIKYIWSLTDGNYYILDDELNISAPLQEKTIAEFLLKVIARRILINGDK